MSLQADLDADDGVALVLEDLRLVEVHVDEAAVVLLEAGLEDADDAEVARRGLAAVGAPERGVEAGQRRDDLDRVADLEAEVLGERGADDDAGQLLPLRRASSAARCLLDERALRRRRSAARRARAARSAASASARRRDLDLRAAWRRHRPSARRRRARVRRAARARLRAGAARGARPRRLALVRQLAEVRGRGPPARPGAASRCRSCGAGGGARARAAQARRASPATSWLGRSSTLGHQLRVDALDQHAAEAVALGQHHLVDDEGRGADGLGQLLARALRRRRGTRRS